MKYESAEQWHAAAMKRSSSLSNEESGRRRQMVQDFHRNEGSDPSAEQLRDYELYIQGKMDMEEYQQYLLFKHRPVYKEALCDGSNTLSKSLQRSC